MQDARPVLPAAVARVLVAAVLTAAVLLPNLRLYGAPSPLAQLAHLRAALEDGAGEDMQALFPEGYFFTYALYGMAWVNAGLGDPGERERALAEARWARDHLSDPRGLAPFSPALDPPYGVFHAGWSAWLSGGILLLQADAARDEAEVAAYEALCRGLGDAFARSPTPFLPAYPGQSWPVDNAVAIAALHLHDTVLPPRFGDTVAHWLDQAMGALDPATGLLPHRTAPAVLGARATSQSLVVRFLAEIDPELAAEHYSRYRDLFVTGVPAVREYPRGTDGPGDVDSGPLVFGLSLSASAVTIGTAHVLGDERLAGALTQAAESAGLPQSTPGGRRYAFGLLPVGDAFLTWSQTSRRWVGDGVPARAPGPPPWWWRLPWHATLLLIPLAWWLSVPRRRSSAGSPASR